MENKTTLHPIHPTLQFEAKQAIRFLDNLLKVRTPSVNCGSIRLSSGEAAALEGWLDDDDCE